MVSVNEELRDRAVRHALAILRYGQGVSDKIVKLLNSADADLIEKLGARLALIDQRGYDTGPATTARINKLLDELGTINGAIYAQVGDVLTSELEKFAVAEADFQRGSLVKGLGVDIDVALPKPEVLKALVTESPIQGKLLTSYVKGMEQGRMDRIDQAIRLGVVQGESTDQIVARIRGTRAARYSDGVLDISRRSATSIVRTATASVSNVAAQETWKSSTVVKAWQFLATLDNHTTIICAGLSGQVFPVGEGPMPPRHLRCRSVPIPVTKSWKELGFDADELSPDKRASMDGQVAGDTTFKDWLTKKGEATQDDILGKTRADLFRSGKLDLQDFIKSDGSVLTLDQLRNIHVDIITK